MNFGQESFSVERGARIAQLVIAATLQAAICEVANLDETTRGVGGFGSTGMGEGKKQNRWIRSRDSIIVPSHVRPPRPKMIHAAPAAQRCSWPLPPSSTSRSMRGAVRSQPKPWRRAIRLPPRHLEPVLQALVRHGILKGIRGPRGGYELARERAPHHGRRYPACRRDGRRDRRRYAVAGSLLLNKVVMPALERPRTPSPPRWRASTSKTWRTLPRVSGEQPGEA